MKELRLLSIGLLILGICGLNGAGFESSFARIAQISLGAIIADASADTNADTSPDTMKKKKADGSDDQDDNSDDSQNTDADTDNEED